MCWYEGACCNNVSRQVLKRIPFLNVKIILLEPQISTTFLEGKKLSIFFGKAQKLACGTAHGPMPLNIHIVKRTLSLCATQIFPDNSKVYWPPLPLWPGAWARSERNPRQPVIKETFPWSQLDGEASHLTGNFHHHTSKFHNSRNCFLCLVKCMHAIKLGLQESRRSALETPSHSPYTCWASPPSGPSCGSAVYSGRWRACTFWGSQSRSRWSLPLCAGLCGPSRCASPVPPAGHTGHCSLSNDSSAFPLSPPSPHPHPGPAGPGPVAACEAGALGDEGVGGHGMGVGGPEAREEEEEVARRAGPRHRLGTPPGARFWAYWLTGLPGLVGPAAAPCCLQVQTAGHHAPAAACARTPVYHPRHSLAVPVLHWPTACLSAQWTLHKTGGCSCREHPGNAHRPLTVGTCWQGRLLIRWCRQPRMWARCGWSCWSQSQCHQTVGTRTVLSSWSGQSGTWMLSAEG